MGIWGRGYIYLCEKEMGIRILDDRRHAVAVEGEESGLLELGGRVDCGGVWDVKLGQKEGDFPGVGTS